MTDSSLTRAGQTNPEALGPGLTLGLDVGGTQSRWALARPGGPVLAEGTAGGFSGQQVLTELGRSQIEHELRVMGEAAAAAAAALGGGPVQRVWAGVTGYDAASGPALGELLAAALALPAQAVRLHNDVELACRLCFAPGAGYLVYAGTGSIGVFVDEAGAMHRVGGRGGVLGDEGSGWWIAREALAAVWRHEDEQPGFLGRSPLAGALLRAIGPGADNWAATRRFVHLASRGEFGRLALAVAAVAEEDALARQILERAGAELARLATLLVRHHGPRPVVVAGRAASLHPLIGQALHAALPDGLACEMRELRTHALAATHAFDAAP
ncbi:MAG: BadF/BadG/BcrA/BcrD ATPase family protein [Rubrivivax sp.]